MSDKNKSCRGERKDGDPSRLAPPNVTTYQTHDDVPYKKDLKNLTFSGASGCVYRAFQASSGPETKTYAVKEIQVPNEKRRVKTERELAMLKRRNNVNILKLVNSYQIQEEPFENTLYLVTEPWAPASLQRLFESLDDKNKSRLCPWYDQSIAGALFDPIFKGFIDGLVYLHEQSIKHKDIKPDNLLLLYIGPSHSGSDASASQPIVRPIIADLGISKIQRPCATTNFTKATYSYLAPEQITHTESTLKADVFSMGCCFALALGVICNGYQGFLEVWKAFMERSVQVAIELPAVLSALDNFTINDTLFDLRPMIK